MKRKKIKPKKKAFEFLFTIFPTYDELNKIDLITIQIQTVQEFTNFRYELQVKETFNEDGMNFQIKGIKTPDLLIPSGGPAVFSQTYQRFEGEKQLSIVNMEGTVNSFKLKFLKNKILLSEDRDQSFIDVVIK
jgi:hypothetical protein